MVGPLDVLHDVVRRLDQAGIEYFLVGSLGAMYYGRPRFTNDIDLVVEIKAQQISLFSQLFPIDEYYCPPIGGPEYYAVYFEDPNRIKVELVAPSEEK